MSDVILYSSDETGVPLLAQNSAGGLITILDGCLVNGFNAKTPTQIVVASGTATVTASAHGYLKGRKVLQGGSTTTALNGVKKILSTPSANTYTFDATGVADGTYNGALTVKRAPLGWSKPFGDSTHGIYQRSDPAATVHMLRVDDSSASAARVFGVETATDINTYTNAFPTTTQVAGGGYWGRRNNGWVGAPVWFIVGDGMSFYLVMASINSGPPNFYLHGFGDLVSLKASDGYKAFVATSEGGVDTNPALPRGNQNPASNVTGSGNRVARDFSGVGVGPLINNLSHGNSYTGGSTSMPFFPSPVDGGMVISDKLAVVEANTLQPAPIRGFYPGLAEPLATIPINVSGGIVSGVVGSSREYLALTLNFDGQDGRGHCLIDVTGPWQ